MSDNYKVRDEDEQLTVLRIKPSGNAGTMKIGERVLPIRRGMLPPSPWSHEHSPKRLTIREGV